MLQSPITNSAQGFMTQLDAAKTSQDTAALKQAKLRKACQMFESHFLKMMWTEMRKTIPKSGMVSGGQAENIFTDMLDQERAEAAAMGRSMGLADMLERQLTSKRLKRLPHQFGSRQDGVSMPTRSNFFRGRIHDPQAADGQEMAETSQSAADQAAASADDQAASIGQGFVSPLRGRVSSLFGSRTHPISGKLTHHDGVDVAAPQGTEIRAAGAGRVVFSGWADGYGNLVELEHSDGRTTRYAHCDKLKVKSGEQVKSGQTIATVGSTGYSTGPHLHFEIINAQGKHIDPMQMVALGTDPHTRRS